MLGHDGRAARHQIRPAAACRSVALSVFLRGRGAAPAFPQAALQSSPEAAFSVLAADEAQARQAGRQEERVWLAEDSPVVLLRAGPMQAWRLRAAAMRAWRKAMQPLLPEAEVTQASLPAHALRAAGLWTDVRPQQTY